MTESVRILELCFQCMVLSSRYYDPLKKKHLLEKCNVTGYHVANRIIYEWETCTCTCNQEVCRSLSVILSFLFWPFYCLSSFDLGLLITPLVSSSFVLSTMDVLCIHIIVHRYNLFVTAAKLVYDSLEMLHIIASTVKYPQWNILVNIWAIHIWLNCNQVCSV